MNCKTEKKLQIRKGSKKRKRNSKTEKELQNREGTPKQRRN